MSTGPTGLRMGRRLPLYARRPANSVWNFPWAVFCTKQQAGSATREYRRRATKLHFSTTRSTQTTVAPCRSSILQDGRKFSLPAGKQRKDWHGLRTEKRFGSRLLDAGLERRIYAVDLSGRQRLVFRVPGGVTLHDIASDGRVLLTRDQQRKGIMALGPGSNKERELSWMDWSFPADLSADGNILLFDEQGEGGGPNYAVAIRDMQGSPPVPLGEGMAGGISPDGKWATTIVANGQLLLLPTGAGTAKRIERHDIEQYGMEAHWLPNGQQIIFTGNQPGHGARCFIQNIDSGKPRPVTPEGIVFCQVSPDGKWIAGSSGEGEA